MFVRPRTKAYVPEEYDFEFGDRKPEVFFNGQDHWDWWSSPDCQAWKQRVTYTLTAISLIPRLIWPVQAGLTFFGEVVDKLACRTSDFEQMKQGSIGNGVSMSNKYYGGISWDRQMEVVGKVDVTANVCKPRYEFVTESDAEIAADVWANQKAGMIPPRMDHSAYDHHVRTMTMTDC